MAFIAIVEMPGGAYIPIIKGDDGPETDCCATWETREAAQEWMSEHILGKAYGSIILDLDDGF